MSETESLSRTVVEHYNKKDPSNLAARSKSRIFFMRNFNNWIKSVLINEFIKIIRSDNRKLSVLDLGCGKGGDSLKWINAKVSRVTFADIAENSLEECKKRVSNVAFKTNFVHIDATKEHLREKMKDIELHELVSSQFVIHYSFESFQQANIFLKNVSESLNPGGYFIGTTTNASELIKRLRQTQSDNFGNEIYQIKFYQDNKDYFDLFGVKFHFKLEGVVECPEFLVNFEALVQIAQRHGLKLVYKKTFSDFFNENCHRPEYSYLISKMQALEPYYPQDLADDTSRRLSGDYDYIDSKLQDETFKQDLKPEETYATLSKSEWEAITLYIVFAFVKENNDKKEANLEKSSQILA